MKPFFEAIPNLTRTTFWMRFVARAMESVDFSTVMYGASSLEEVAALFDAARRRNQPHIMRDSWPSFHSEFGVGSWERLVVTNAREVWVVRKPLSLDDFVLVVVVARSGQVFLMTNRDYLLKQIAGMNRWSRLANGQGCSLEAKSMRIRQGSAGFSIFTCSAMRIRCESTPATSELLEKLELRAVGASVMSNVLWDGSKRLRYSVREGNFRQRGMFAGSEVVRDPDVPMFLAAWRSHTFPVVAQVEDCRAWPNPGAAFFGSRLSARLHDLDAPQDALCLALSMGTGVHVSPMLSVKANRATMLVVWHQYDARPLTQIPNTGLSFQAQALHGSAYLTRAVKLLRTANSDYKADALRRSIRHICHAYEGRHLEQHPLSVCLAVEELATTMMVEEGTLPVRRKNGRSLHQVAHESFVRRRGRPPTREELVVEAMLSGTDWNAKVDYLRKKFRVKFVTGSRKDAVRLLRNGIIHAGRLLPDKRRAFAALHNLESFWHSVAWAMCGERNPSLNIGRFSQARRLRGRKST